MKRKIKVWAWMLTLCLTLGLLAGCANSEQTRQPDGGKNTFVFGDTTFNPENDEPDRNPHTT